MNQYQRLFVALTRDSGGYDFGGRQPSGRCLAEVRSGTGKISLWAQDLSPEALYKVCLVFAPGGRDGYIGVSAGFLAVDARGKSEFRLEFGGDGFWGHSLDTLKVVAVTSRSASGINTPLAGFVGDPVVWKDKVIWQTAAKAASAIVATGAVLKPEQPERPAVTAPETGSPGGAAETPADGLICAETSRSAGAGMDGVTPLSADADGLTPLSGEADGLMPLSAEAEESEALSASSATNSTDGTGETPAEGLFCAGISRSAGMEADGLTPLSGEADGLTPLFAEANEAEASNASSAAQSPDGVGETPADGPICAETSRSAGMEADGVTPLSGEADEAEASNASSATQSPDGVGETPADGPICAGISRSAGMEADGLTPLSGEADGLTPLITESEEAEASNASSATQSPDGVGETPADGPICAGISRSAGMEADGVTPFSAEADGLTPLSGEAEEAEVLSASSATNNTDGTGETPADGPICAGISRSAGMEADGVTPLSGDMDRLTPLSAEADGLTPLSGKADVLTPLSAETEEPKVLSADSAAQSPDAGAGIIASAPGNCRDEYIFIGEREGAGPEAESAGAEASGGDFAYEASGTETAREGAVSAGEQPELAADFAGQPMTAGADDFSRDGDIFGWKPDGSAGQPEAMRSECAADFAGQPMTAGADDFSRDGDIFGWKPDGSADTDAGSDADFHEQFREMARAFGKELAELERLAFGYPEPKAYEPARDGQADGQADRPMTDGENRELADIDSLFMKNTQLFPFKKQNRDVQWIRIFEEDEALLPGAFRAAAKSAFATAAYKRHGHMILGLVSDDNGRHCILGVPGIYEPLFKPTALKLGFTQFKCCDDVRPGYGEYGYWLMLIGI
ncbi:MAG: hypothetical protein FWC55_02680 [Firmicutes bacterium]|nr:hypothetical protein [Bacillota bacterium]